MAKKEFWSFNKAELIMDIILILYAVFFSRFLHANSDVYLASSPAVIFVCMTLLAMFLPWYMGVIYARYRYVYGAIIAFIPLLIMLFSLFFLASILFSFNEQAIADLQITSKAKPLYLVCIILLLLYIMRSFYIGFKTEKDMMKGNSFDSENEEYLRFFFLSFCLSSAFVFCLIYFAREVPEEIHSEYNSVFVILAAFISAIGLAFLATKLLKRLQNYFPVFIISLFLCWTSLLECSFIELMKLTDSTDKFLLIVLLVFTGVIPFRIVLLFAPPLKAINLVIGIIAMICYFYFLG
ncbi:MAG TPA: hypothetical protein VJI69_07105 [Bacteroidia bacterium]|nr:hypothetical protein [Bacteroidia bacterium]